MTRRDKYALTDKCVLTDKYVLTDKQMLTDKHMLTDKYVLTDKCVLTDKYVLTNSNFSLQRSCCDLKGGVAVTEGSRRLDQLLMPKLQSSELVCCCWLDALRLGMPVNR